MKKHIALLLILSLLLLAACSAPPAVNGGEITDATDTGSAHPTEQTMESPSAVYDGLMAAASMPLIVEHCTSEDGKPIAYYTHQDMHITLPDADVAQIITLDLLNRIDRTRSDAEDVFRSAKADYSAQGTWHPYSYVITCSPMRLDQNILSLYVFETAFDGSPRTTHNIYSLNYDLATGDILNLVTIFHEENFADAICDLVIEGLAALDQDTLYSDYESIVRDKFSTNATVESWYFGESGLCFYFTPYEIAPYVSGVVVSEISYEALSGLLKDKYFPGEKLNYTGSLTAQVITADNAALLDNFRQFANVTVEPGTKQFLINTQGSVSNVRIHQTTDSSTGIIESTILLVPGMGPSDGILLEVSESTAAQSLYITYESNGRVETFRFS